MYSKDTKLVGDEARARSVFLPSYQMIFGSGQGRRAEIYPEQPALDPDMIHLNCRWVFISCMATSCSVRNTNVCFSSQGRSDRGNPVAGNVVAGLK